MRALSWCNGQTQTPFLTDHHRKLPSKLKLGASTCLWVSKSNPLWTLCNILLTKLDLQCVDDWVTHKRPAIVSENYIAQSHFYKIVVPIFLSNSWYPISWNPYLSLAFNLSFIKISEFFVALFYFLIPKSFCVISPIFVYYFSIVNPLFTQDFM